MNIFITLLAIMLTLVAGSWNWASAEPYHQCSSDGCCCAMYEDCIARPNHPDAHCRAGTKPIEDTTEANCFATGCLWSFQCEPIVRTGSVTESANGIDDDCDGFVDDEQCDNVDNDGDGLTDEDPGSCLMRILFVPLSWQGSQAEFEAAARKQFNFFINSLDLAACPDNYTLKFLSVATDNLPVPACENDCGVGEVRRVFQNNSSENMNDFDVVVALTDQNICDSTAGCSNSKDFVWVETSYDVVLAHELGHIQGLGDEYCSRDAGSTCDHCNAGSPPPPNFLGSDFGCDPREGQGCCQDCSGEVGTCKDDYEICCQGNINTQGGRCIMSYVNADGPREFCDRCFQHMTDPPNPRSETNRKGQIPMNCSFTHLGHERILNMDYSIDENGHLSVKSASVGLGRLGIGAPGNEGHFAIEIVDSQGNRHYHSAFNPNFRPDPQASGVDYSGIQYQWADLGLRAILPTSVTNTKIMVRKDGVLTSQTCLVPSGGAPNALITVMVADSTPPTITCPADATFECKAPGGTPATDATITAFLAGASATDTCDFAPTVSHNAPVLFKVGTTPVSFTATDADGNASTCTANGRVVDTTAPVISSVAASPQKLWSPNHEMIPVTLNVAVADVCDPGSRATCKITTVTSNEPENGLGDGDRAPDWTITGALTVDLRAERAGTGSGRVYTVTVQCSDASGNSANQAVTVAVPHDNPHPF